ncbi:MAG: hypothetical protein LBT65_02235 [Synergistaceae bacterium]|jgi:hypothetical protein|nr:hypothetical protein [Synergistaceae bacterium]
MERTVLRRVCGLLVLACLLGSLFLGAADAAVNAKKRKYNKNALPSGWQYEPGYTLWRLQQGLVANPNTYRKYRRDKVWNQQHHKGFRPGVMVVDGLDWTEEEIAKFWESYNEYFKFHPSGVEN